MGPALPRPPQGWEASVLWGGGGMCRGAAVVHEEPFSSSSKMRPWVAAQRGSEGFPQVELCLPASLTLAQGFGSGLGLPLASEDLSTTS